LSTFLGFTAPTGATVFTNKAWIITPIAGGIGFGDFDIQGTVGIQIPTDQQSIIGTAFVTNVAFQYHLFQYLWPEFEFNDTAWSGGLRNGQNQLFLTPGIIFGRFNLGPPTVNLNVGIGYQFAVSPVPRGPGAGDDARLQSRLAAHGPPDLLKYIQAGRILLRLNPPGPQVPSNRSFLIKGILRKAAQRACRRSILFSFHRERRFNSTTQSGAKRVFGWPTSASAWSRSHLRGRINVLSSGSNRL
jgi:hypothetical protein